MKSLNNKENNRFLILLATVTLFLVNSLIWPSLWTTKTNESDFIKQLRPLFSSQTESNNKDKEDKETLLSKIKAKAKEQAFFFQLENSPSQETKTFNFSLIAQKPVAISSAYFQIYFFPSNAQMEKITIGKAFQKGTVTKNIISSNGNQFDFAASFENAIQLTPQEPLITITAKMKYDEPLPLLIMFGKKTKVTGDNFSLDNQEETLFPFYLSVPTIAPEAAE